MTEGRFETTFNLRPPGWDERTHWTKTHSRFAADPLHVLDHMERESCPFHDLRANGCFQPEYDGLGVAGAHLEPTQLTSRRDGNRVQTAGASIQPLYRGVGGKPEPFDVVPAKGPDVGRTGRPWTTTKKYSSLFSAFKHMADTPGSHPKAPFVQPFHAGFSPNLIGRPQRHYPEPYRNPSHHSRGPSRLRAGSASRRPYPEAAQSSMPQENKSLKSRPASAAPRPQFVAERPIKGAFQRFPEHMADPWAPAGIKKSTGPLFTYAAKSKRCMPVAVPWKAGLTTAEPARGSVPQIREVPRFATLN